MLLLLNSPQGTALSGTYTISLPSAALVSATLAPSHAVSYQVLVQWDGNLWTDESDYLISIIGNENVDPTSRFRTAGQVTIELDNSTGRYDPSNAASPIYSYLTHTGQKVQLYLGYNGVTTLVGTYWIDILDPVELTRIASVRALDKYGQIQNTMTTVSPDVNQAMDVVFSRLCDAAGLVLGVDYQVDPATKTCPYFVAAHSTLHHELEQVAQAEGGRFFVDVNGLLTFWSYDHHRLALRTSLVTLTRSTHAYDLARPRRTAAAVNRFTLEYDTRQSISVPEIIYSQVTPMVLPAATSIGGKVFYAPITVELAAMDMIRWERYLKAQFTTIASITGNTAIDGSGAAVTMTPVAIAPQNGISVPSNTCYYRWSPSGSIGKLEFWNASSGRTYITALTINGKPQRTVAPYAVQANDDASQELNGGVVVEHRMRNGYLPSSDLAMVLATDEMFIRSAIVASVDLPSIDGMPFLHVYDTFNFVDDSVSPAVTYGLMVLRNDWKFNPTRGYECSLVTAPGLPETDTVLPTVIVVLPTVGAPANGTPGFPAGTTQSPPWYWGSGSPQDATWTYFDWG